MQSVKITLEKTYVDAFRICEICYGYIYCNLLEMD